MNKLIKYIVAILVITLILSCKKEPDYIEGINGLNRLEIIQLFGKPQGETEFQLTDTLYEYQYGLIDKFPELRKEKVIITELYWFKNNNKKIVVWLYKNDNNVEVIDNLVWFDDEIQF